MAVNPLVKALQLPEGFTVRKVKGVLKVVPAKERKAAIAKKEETMETTIIHKCGHSRISRSEDGEYLKKETERDCPDCRVDLQNYGFYPIRKDELVELQGSEKQVNWAVKIRKDFVDRANDRIKDAKRRRATEDDVARMRRYFITIFNEQDQAKFWIDHRYDTLKIFDPAWQAMIAKESEVLK